MGIGFIVRPLAMTVTASNTAAGYSAANVALDSPGSVWKSATGSNTRNLVIDLGADTPLDTITLHGLTGAQSGWQWGVDLATSAQGSFGGSYWSGTTETLLAGSIMPVNGKGRALWLAPGAAPTSARYVRLAFSGLSSAAIEVARVVIGARIQIGGGFAYGAALGIRPLGTLDFSTRGVILRRRGTNLRGIGVTVEAATREQVEAQIMPMFERAGNTEGVVIVVDPEANAQRQNRIYFGFLTGDIGSIWAGYNRFTSSFNLVAVD